LKGTPAASAFKIGAIGVLKEDCENPLAEEVNLRVGPQYLYYHHGSLGGQYGYLSQFN